MAEIPQAERVSDLAEVTGVGWVVSYFRGHEKILREGREDDTMKIAFDSKGNTERCVGEVLQFSFAGQQWSQCG